MFTVDQERANPDRGLLGDDEVRKFLRRCEGWLPTRPEREIITVRYPTFAG